MSGSLRPWGLASALTAGAGAWLYWLQGQALRWDHDPQATCMPVSCFCEAVRDAAIRQPADTWSNLAYVFFGGLIAGGAGKDRGLATAFGLLALFQGLTSAYFHAALTFRSEWWDVGCMYLIPGFLLLFCLRRMRVLGRGATWAAFAGMTAATGVFLEYVTEYRTAAFIGLIAAYLLLETAASRRARAQRRWLWRAMGTFALAFAIWILDRRHIVCSPDSLWQGHALWHVLCAFVIWSLYLFCEDNPPAVAGH